MEFGYFPVLVDSNELRRIAHQIRRECFAVDEDSDEGSVLDEYEVQSNAHTYLLFDEDKSAVGTIRLCVYSAAYGWQRIPVLDLFPDLVDGHYFDGTAIVHSSYFAVSPGRQGPGLLTKLLLIREFIRTAVVHQADQAVTIIRNIPTRVSFFSRLGFRTIGSPVLHPWAKKEVVLIAASPAEALQAARSHSRLSAVGAFEYAL